LGISSVLIVALNRFLLSTGDFCLTGMLVCYTFGMVLGVGAIILGDRSRGSVYRWWAIGIGIIGFMLDQLFALAILAFLLSPWGP
jgi:hypothetical protein